MRHGKKINHLSRTSSHRKAMLANMASSLIIHKRIKTTLAKAKALRCYVEPLITKSKEDSTHNRRTVFSYLQDKEAVNELFREVSTKVSERPGGYTRILKLGPRLGDNAEMCMIELVDYNENLLDVKDTKGRRTRRGRKGSGAKAEPAAKAAIPATDKTKEKPVEEPAKEKKPEPETAMEEKPVENKSVVAEETREEKPVDEVKDETKEEDDKKEK